MDELDPMAEWEQSKREKRTHRLIVLGIFASMIAVVLIWRTAHGRQMNESCSSNDDCGDDGACLFTDDNIREGRCSKGCNSDQDCPSDMSCHFGWAMDDAGKKMLIGSREVCMPN